MKGGVRLPSGWLTSCLSWAAQAWNLAVPSPLRPKPVYMTYGVWALPLPIPLRVQFSDKQKHIQALASHFTLCALAGGNAFLEPLAYSPKNGSSWLSLLKKKNKKKGGVGGWGGDATCGGLGSIFHPPRSLLALYYQSHHCSRWVGKPAPWTHTHTQPRLFHIQHKLTCATPPHTHTHTPSGSYNCAQGLQTWTYNLPPFLSAPSFRAWVGFQLLVGAGVHISPATVGGSAPDFDKKLYSCDSEYSYRKSFVG